MTVLHASQCFHRDIAPDNILLTSKGPLLLDFGAARRVIGGMTHALTVVLKPGYAPIEQYGDVASMSQGAWTDIYALACVVYYAITGRIPMSSVERLMDDRLEPLAVEAKGRYSDAFLRAIDAALSVRPADRPQSEAAFRALLDVGRPKREPAPAPPSGYGQLQDAGLPAEESLLPTMLRTVMPAVMPEIATQIYVRAPMISPPVLVDTVPSQSFAEPSQSPQPTGPAALDRQSPFLPSESPASLAFDPHAQATVAATAPRRARGRLRIVAGTLTVVALGAATSWAWQLRGDIGSTAAGSSAASAAGLASSPAAAAAALAATSAPVAVFPVPVPVPVPVPAPVVNALPGVPKPAPAAPGATAPAASDPSSPSTPLRARREAPPPLRTRPEIEPATDTATGSRLPTTGAKCSDILQKASLEPLTAEDAAYLKRDCR